MYTNSEANAYTYLKARADLGVSVLNKCKCLICLWLLMYEKLAVWTTRTHALHHLKDLRRKIIDAIP